MIILKKGDYKLRDCFLELECTGSYEYQNKRKPCHSILKIEDGDIVKLECEKYPKLGIPGEKYDLFGFVCCECHCFTEVPSTQIPKEVRDYCVKIATKNSPEYQNLTEEGKKLSEYL